VTQGQYYKWRDQLLNNGEKAFETNPDKALVEAKKGESSPEIDHWHVDG